ncbi:MAG: hypothetical protein R3F54_21355 [Alphaproteobacteria bacterium]
MRLFWMTSAQIAALLAAAAFGLSGCNTVAGAVSGLGRDISAVGSVLADVSGSDCRSRRCSRHRRDRW